MDTEILYELKARYTMMIEYVAGTSNPQLIGEAPPGSLPSEAKWRIRYINWDGDNNPTCVQWAGGTAKFDKVWDDRAIYEYS